MPRLWWRSCGLLLLAQLTCQALGESSIQESCLSDSCLASDESKHFSREAAFDLRSSDSSSESDANIHLQTKVSLNNDAAQSPLVKADDVVQVPVDASAAEEGKASRDPPSGGHRSPHVGSKSTNSAGELGPHRVGDRVTKHAREFTPGNQVLVPFKQLGVTHTVETFLNNIIGSATPGVCVMAITLIALIGACMIMEIIQRRQCLESLAPKESIDVENALDKPLADEAEIGTEVGTTLSVDMQPTPRRQYIPHNPELECIHDVFEEVALRYPNSAALEVTGESVKTYTYKELNAFANTVAGHLRCLEIPQNKMLRHGESLVAVLAHRTTAEPYAAQLGIFKAGMTYVPLDPKLPDGRLKAILSSTSFAAILTDAACEARGQEICSDLPKPLLCLRIGQRPTLHQLRSADGGEVKQVRATEDSLAYIMYTSGTTGTPKGVMITHGNLMNLVRSFGYRFPFFDHTWRFSQLASLAVDWSLEDTWSAWAVGGCLVVIPDDVVLNMGEFLDWCNNKRLTYLDLVPTLLREVTASVKAGKEAASKIPTVRFMKVGSEPMTDDMVAAWGRKFFFVNTYGPTETTCEVLAKRLRPGMDVTLGGPWEGVQAHVLDEDGNRCPDGQEGELVISGKQLGRGYLGALEMSKAKYPMHPTIGRMYATGDCASVDEQGEILCFGRIDGQVKIRGHRVELDDVESFVFKIEGVRSAVCNLQTNDAGTVELCAHLVLKEGRCLAPDDIDPAMMRKQLMLDLPVHMVPTRFGVINEIKRTVTGKVDRKTLPMLVNNDDKAFDVITADDAKKDDITKSDDESERSTKPSTESEGQSPAFTWEETVGQALGKGLGWKEEEIFPIESWRSKDLFGELGLTSIGAARTIAALRVQHPNLTMNVAHIYKERNLEALVVVSPAPKVSNSLWARVGPKRWLTKFTEAEPQSYPATYLLVKLLIRFSGVGFGVGTGAFSLALMRHWLRHSGPEEELFHRGFSLSLLLFFVTIFLGLVGPFFTLALAIIMKRLLIGKYRAGRHPLWGWYHIRHELCTMFTGVPLGLFVTDEAKSWVFRMLGAKIGSGVSYTGGSQLAAFDLVEIGDRSSLNQGSNLLTVQIRGKFIEFGPVSIGSDCTVEAFAKVSLNSRMSDGSMLTVLSVLSSGDITGPGERWSGRPAKCTDLPVKLSVSDRHRSEENFWNRQRSASALFTAVYSLWLVKSLVLFCVMTPLGLRLIMLRLDWQTQLPLSFLLAMFGTLFSMLLDVLWLRWLPTVRAGKYHLSSFGRYLYAEKLGTLAAWAEFLGGTIFYPYFLRATGAKVGRNCEMDITYGWIPELVDIDKECFFAGLSCMVTAASSHAQQFICDKVKLEKRAFLGNNCVVSGGCTIPSGVLIGVSTAVDYTAQEELNKGKSMFGHPPLELQRPAAASDETGRYTAPWSQYFLRMFIEVSRLFFVGLLATWGWLTFLTALAIIAHLHHDPATLAAALSSWSIFTTFVVPLSFCVGTKWMFLGKVVPGEHALWSLYVYLWDLQNFIWNVIHPAVLSGLNGSIFTPLYVNALGGKVGRHAFVPGPCVDPDMMIVGDEASVASDCWQCHTFEDRVLKIDYVNIGASATVGQDCTLLYGAEVGEGAALNHGTVLMKHESVPAGSICEGYPVVPRLAH